MEIAGSQRRECASYHTCLSREWHCVSRPVKESQDQHERFFCHLLRLATICKPEARLALVSCSFPFPRGYTQLGLAVGVTMSQHYAVHEIQHGLFTRSFTGAASHAGRLIAPNKIAGAYNHVVHLVYLFSNTSGDF
ncbi:uncharacterized protein TRIVIDRAFT_60366 [Trichoderma virens Gv29-8]|uniref:Uncharacterized protein n=1 Tax=Hypocrea virens (strain Gv29-8 / FGSC 10586) TaxID=413071 RepID=G9MRT1_HYPVG|nr:uncharacterized protein TRIVIDRAFT_60366 [Trichoderma virens Gv29-8]EHK22800.1 hypothetical protein TRIVIDRAFT_60366 [Trichoderma virens Gv29-8]